MKINETGKGHSNKNNKQKMFDDVIFIKMSSNLQNEERNEPKQINNPKKATTTKEKVK